jgi:hypothetical protein
MMTGLPLRSTAGELLAAKKLPFTRMEEEVAPGAGGVAPARNMELWAGASAATGATPLSRFSGLRLDSSSVVGFPSDSLVGERVVKCGSEGWVPPGAEADFCLPTSEPKFWWRVVVRPPQDLSLEAQLLTDTTPGRLKLEQRSKEALPSHRLDP